MALGYEVYEDKREFEQKGLTGDVRRYTTTKMSFPCFILCSSDCNTVPSHSIEVLHKMFPTSKIYDETLTDSMIYIYFNHEDTTVKMGAIQPGQVKTFLRLFEGCDIDCYLNADKKLEGMYMYVLAE